MNSVQMTTDSLNLDLSNHTVDTMEIMCDCSIDTFWACQEVSAVSRWPGELFEIPEADALLAMCPECAHIREVTIDTKSRPESKVVLRFIIGDIILPADEAASCSMRQFNDRIEEAVGLDPNRLYSCTQCGTAIFRSDQTSGPEVPEIGWEYYQCSECGERYAPNTVESSQ